MLNEFLQDELSEKEENQSFKVTDLNSANWCFRKLRALAEQQKEYEELASAEIERVNNWLQGERAKIEYSKGYFEGLLTEYTMEQRINNPKFKISTPYGKVSSRKQQDKWVYNDTKIIESLKKSGLTDYIKIVEEVNKADLKKVVKVYNGKAVTEDGEEIEGITITPQSEKIEIKVETD